MFSGDILSADALTGENVKQQPFVLASLLIMSASFAAEPDSGTATVTGQGDGRKTKTYEEAYTSAFYRASNDAKRKCKEQGYGYDGGSTTLQNKQCGPEGKGFHCSVSVNMNCTQR